MKNSFFNSIFGAFLVAILLCSCKGCFKRDLSNIPEAVTDSLSIVLPPSSINIPVSFAVQKLEELVNHKISGKFLEVIIYPLKSEKDEALLTFTKIRPIVITISGDRLNCKVPLEVDAKLLKSRYGNFITKRVRPLEAQAVIELETPVSLSNDWGLVTKFDLRKVRWIKDPILHIGPFKENLKEELSEALHKNEAKLTGLLNHELSKAISLQSVVAKIWSDLQKPMFIHRTPPAAWMKFSCDSIAGKMALEDGMIKCYTNVAAKMMMVTDTTSLAPATALPSFKPLDKISKESDIYLYAFTSFEEINMQLNTLFAGRKFSAKGYTIAIDTINAYASTAGLSVEVKTSGDVAGTVVASGQLGFDPRSQQVRINNFDYAMSTNSTLLNAADELLHSVIQDTITSKLIVGLDSLIGRVPQLVENAIAKGKPGNTIELNLNSLAVKNCEISMGAKRMHFNIHAGVAAEINIKKINKGKRINVKAKPKK